MSAALAAGLIWHGAAAVPALATPALAVELQSSVTVDLAPQNDSGISGTAELTDTTEGLRVVVALHGARNGATHPAHIHRGGCGDSLGRVTHSLESVRDGSSTSVLRGVLLEDLAVTAHAINVARARDDIATYIACGPIIASGTGGRIAQSEPTATPPAATASTPAAGDSGGGPPATLPGTGGPSDALVPALLAGVLLAGLGLAVRRLRPAVD